MGNGNHVQRTWWNVQRFGWTPSKLGSRASRHDGPRIVLNSLPKAGTHLLERGLCQHPQLYRAPVGTLHRRTLKNGEGQLRSVAQRLRPNQIIVSHLEFAPERAEILAGPGFRLLFMIRDPREIVVSQAHFIASRPKHPFYELFANAVDSCERFRLVIEGSQENGFPSIRSRLEAFHGWLTSDSLVVRYEDLVGPQGGGSPQRQLATLENVFAHLRLEVRSDTLERFAANTFSSTSPTFRRGTIGQWRTQFDEATKEFFEARAGDIAARYGYPA